MKRLISRFMVSAMMVLAASTARAQVTDMSELDSLNVYFIMTGDSTFEVLPLEMGKVTEHRNKVSKFNKLVKKATSVASAGLFVKGVTGGAGSVAKTLQAMNTVDNISSAAGVVNGLAGIEGKDIAFKGKNSSYKVKSKKGGVRVLVKTKDDDADPMQMFRVVRFFELDGDRRVQWGEYKPAVVGKEKEETHGYIGFTAEKYKDREFVLNIPESQLKKGEYGIFVMDIMSAIALPVGTFSVK